MNNYKSIYVPDNCTHVKLDIGLSYTAPVSNKWLIKEPNLLVLGYEPVIENCNNILSINNGKSHPFQDFVLEKKFLYEKRFQLFNYALENVNEQTIGEMIINKNDKGTSSLYNHNQTRLGPIDYKQQTNIISLKMVFDKFPWDKFEYIDYIKIDAQGSDLNILKSAGDYLKEKVAYVTAEPDGEYYIGAETNTEENITNYMKSQNFERINHPFTVDPTYINKKFIEKKDEIFIHQCGPWPC
jgi:FkbM family methyltransferase